jgi:hypothetical protein
MPGTKDQNVRAAAEAARVILQSKNVHDEQQDATTGVANASCTSAPKPYQKPLNPHHSVMI